jgi:quercetin dioxygenase-like cupin family protein
MKILKILPVILFMDLAVIAVLHAQDVQFSDETIQVIDYPLSPHAVYDASYAQVGTDQLFQMEVMMVEIPPGGTFPPQRHFSEELIYIVSGEGYTTMWLREGEKKEKYNWSAGDMLSPTLNAWHQHVNTSADEPARYLALSSSPLVENLFQDQDMISRIDYAFEERWEKNITQQPEYAPIGRQGMAVVRMMIGHHIANLPGREMNTRREGVLGITVRPEGDMAGNHIMEWEVREYQHKDSVSPQHRHPWETVYYIMKGEGYAILQRPGESERRINWQEGDLFIVEANEFHEIRPLEDSTPRFWQVKASGYFHNVGNLMIDEAFRGLREAP